MTYPMSYAAMSLYIHYSTIIYYDMVYVDDMYTYVCVMDSISAPAGETGDRNLPLSALVCIYLFIYLFCDLI